MDSSSDSEYFDSDEEEIKKMIISQLKTKFSEIPLPVVNEYPRHIAKKLRTERNKVDKINSVFNSKGANYVDKILLSSLPVDTKAYLVKKMEEPVSSSDIPKRNTWCSAVLDLPLEKIKKLPAKTDINNFLLNSRKILDETIYGMTSVKEEIIDFLVEFINSGGAKGRVLGLHGAPGLGKTKICLALSKILKLPLAKISLGGISDAAVLLGHDSTYVGSKPGAIAAEIKKAGCMNFIFCLDEIDKVNSEKNGVYGVLTHILDETQNNDFRDSYLDGVPLDLSNILFITTMNKLEDIDPIVLNRIKVIHIPALTTKEKLFIVKNYVIPELNSPVFSIEIKESLIEYIVCNKTKQEPGMRNIRQNLTTVFNRMSTVHSLTSCKDSKKIKLGFSYKDLTLEYSKENRINLTKQNIDSILKNNIEEAPWMSMYV
jgi:ATP-dependent Lon protease